MKRSPKTLAITVAAVGLVSVSACGTTTDGHGPQHRPIGGSSTAAPIQPAPVAISNPTPVLSRTMLATVRGATWEGAPEILPVVRSTPTDLLLRMPQRPNGTTQWFPRSDVTLTYTDYAITVNLTAHTLVLTDAGKTVTTAPVGNGAADDPTPTGDYFIAYKGRAPSVGYGPWVLVTSDHSNTIANWEGTGDANIGIHGPLGMDAQIPGAISHGCIRMHLADLAKLAVIPSGTPVKVTA